MEGNPTELLKEQEGSYCEKCDVQYFAKIEECQKCKGPTQPAPWYTRFIVERLAFIFTAPLLIAGAYVLLRSSEAAKDEFGFLGVYLMFVVGLFCFVSGAKTVLGIGGFTEQFSGRSLPERARKAFDIVRFGLEFIYVGGIILAILLVAGAASVLGWATSSKP